MRKPTKAEQVLIEKAAAERIDATFKINATILADFNAMMNEVLESGHPEGEESLCGCVDPFVHSMDYCIEMMMKGSLRAFHIGRVTNRYI